MFRRRVNVTSGCIRCKIRRKKCDEQKPKCSFCSRWNLDCEWPGARAGGAQQSRASKSSDGITNKHRRLGPEALTISDIAASNFDPFHDLTAFNKRHRYVGTLYLRHFFTSMITGAIPFDMSIVRRELAHGWAQSIFADDAVCFAFTAYSARLQAKRTTLSTHEQYALGFETRAITDLRKRLNSAQQPSELTILIGAVHFVLFALSNPSARELTRVFKGITNMVQACGGYDEVMAQMQLSTFRSVDSCDIITAFLTSNRPFRQKWPRPLRPRSMDILYTDEFCHAELASRCEANIITVLEDMHFVLFFREPSRQTRSLLPDEAWYLFRFFDYFDNYLAHLQAEYAGQGSLAEVIVLTLIIVKQEVVAEAAQHTILIRRLLRRLRVAILAVLVNADRQTQDVIAWACIIALFGSHAKSTRNRFYHIMTSILQVRYNSQELPVRWQTDLLAVLSSILWHHRLQKRYFEQTPIFERNYDTVIHSNKQKNSDAKTSSDSPSD